MKSINLAKIVSEKFFQLKEKVCDWYVLVPRHLFMNLFAERSEGGRITTAPTDIKDLSSMRRMYGKVSASVKYA